MLQPLRQLKHRAFVTSKKVKFSAQRYSLRFNDWRWAQAEEKRPFVYRGFPHTFLSYPSEYQETRPEDAPRILWLCWMGGHMSETRRESLAQLQQQKSLDIRLITCKQDIELSRHPFHSAYRYLSPIQKTDYIRAYAMHYFGGIYADIKPYQHDLCCVLDQLNSTDNWVAGYREITSEYAPEMPYELGRALKRHYRALIGPSAFAFKPHSPFTSDWMAELHRTLTYFEDQLRSVSEEITDPYNLPAEYPIRWTEIICTIIHPLSLKYQEHIMFTDSIKPDLKNYR